MEIVTNIARKSTILLFISALFICSPIIADEIDKQSSAFKERLGFHTNTIQWALVTPNLGIEYDIIHKETRKVSLMFQGKYNWNSDHKINGYTSNRYVYNILGGRTELRFYFRTRKRENWENSFLESTKEKGLYNRLHAYRHLATSKNNPRTHRAYYIAPYVSYDKFTIKLTDTGVQGKAASAGLSFGFNTPLYLYKGGGAIDFEIGASVGAVYTAYHKFGYNSEDGCYTHTSTKSSRMLPYPVVTDIRVGFVYRFKSISKQIITHNTKKTEELYELYKITKKYNSNIERFTKPNSPIYFSPDSIKNWNNIVTANNNEVNKINKEYAHADSAALLTELKHAYEYLEIPEKTLIKSQRKKLPNIAITSIKEINIPYYDKLFAKYEDIEDEGVIESIETTLLKTYNSSRATVFNQTGDSVADIPLISFLVDATLRINEHSIASHNQKYFIGDDKNNKEFIESSIAKIKIQRETMSETAVQSWNPANNFLNREDTLYLKDKKIYNAKGQNDIIRYENTVKRMALQKSYTAQPDAKNKDKSNEKPAEKPAEKEEATTNTNIEVNATETTSSNIEPAGNETSSVQEEPKSNIKQEEDKETEAQEEEETEQQQEEEASKNVVETTDSDASESEE